MLWQTLAIGKILRGSLITNCLESDINILNDTIKVQHSPKQEGILLDQYFSLKDKNMSFWFDLKILVKIIVIIFLIILKTLI